MAFNSRNLSAIVDSIGGGSVRVYGYYLDGDTVATATAADYIPKAADNGLRKSDVIVLFDKQGASTETVISAIGASGSATLVASQAGPYRRPDLPANVQGLTFAQLMEREFTLEEFYDGADGSDAAPMVRRCLKYMFDRGGGTAVAKADLYRFLSADPDLTSCAVWMRQRCRIKGQAPAFVNQFSDNINAAKGTRFVLGDGKNIDMFKVRLDLTSETNNDYRHGGGFEDVVIWGNRSLSAARGVTNLNTVGDCISIEGARYITVKNVYTMMAAEAGVRSISHTYGVTSVPCNNLLIDYLHAHNNGAQGVNLSGGDSHIGVMNCGYNGSTGATLQIGGPITGLSAWNNGATGVFIGGAQIDTFTQLLGAHAYDNEGDGFIVSSSKNILLVGCQARGNGFTTLDKDGFVVSLNAVLPVLIGCHALGKSGQAFASQRYGFNIGDMVTPVDGNDNFVVWGDNFADAAHLVSPYFFGDMAKVRMHGLSNHHGLRHPGFKALGTIDLDGQALRNILGLSLSGYLTAGAAQITAGSLNCGANSLVRLLATGNVTITDIVSAQPGVAVVVIEALDPTDTVTIAHNTAKIRLNGQANFILKRYQSITLYRPEGTGGTIWQEISGARA